MVHDTQPDTANEHTDPLRELVKSTIKALIEHGYATSALPDRTED